MRGGTSCDVAVGHPTAQQGVCEVVLADARTGCFPQPIQHVSPRLKPGVGDGDPGLTDGLTTLSCFPFPHRLSEIEGWASPLPLPASWGPLIDKVP